MKRALWPQIKVGSFVVYADRYRGVYKAKVTEIDVKVYEPGEPSRWGYPYGKTTETGACKISYNETEILENLENLVAYTPFKLGKLRRAWTKYQDSKATTDLYEEQYLTLIQEYLLT